MRAYHLFAGEDYYPRGGLKDYIGSYETVAEAVAAASALPEDDRNWAEVAATAGNGSLVSVLVGSRSRCSPWGSTWGRLDLPEVIDWRRRSDGRSDPIDPATLEGP